MNIKLSTWAIGGSVKEVNADRVSMYILYADGNRNTIQVLPEHQKYTYTGEVVVVAPFSTSGALPKFLCYKAAIIISEFSVNIVAAFSIFASTNEELIMATKAISDDGINMEEAFGGMERVSSLIMEADA